MDVCKKLYQISITILLFLSMIATVSAEEAFTPVFHPVLNVTKTSGDIKIDGHLNDAGWMNAAEANHFHERSPGDNSKPIVKTRAFITYSETHLYLSAICYDNPDEIRTTLCARDRTGGDNIGFFFDTYGDAAMAYTVNVNPFGVQADALWSNGFGEDGMFDLVFESAGQVTDSGFQVELAIPFSSLRFPDKEEQEWRMQFWRHHNRDVHYNITWAANDRTESNWVRNWGYIKGIKNVKPGKGIEIIPAFTSKQNGSLIENINDGSLDFDNENPVSKLSLSGKYSISSDITLDATFNPDFSNVETDAYQISVNSPTALSVPEKRPFFQEGSDLYRTNLNLVYTRSINEPDFATKLTARLGRTSISYLGAHDKTGSPFIIPFEERSTGVIYGGKSYSNILRVRRTFGSGSQIGLLLTDRRWDEDYGGNSSTYGVDGVFSFSRQVTLRAQLVGSHTQEPDNTNHLADGVGDSTFNNGKYTTAFDEESFSGYAGRAKLSYNSRNFYIQGVFTEFSPTFRADNGWVTRNDRRSVSVYTEYHYRIPEGFIERINLQFNPIRIWNTDGRMKDEALYTTLWVPTRFYQLSMNYQYMISNEEYAGVYYTDIWNHNFNFNISPSELLAFGASYNYGNQLAYGYETLGRQKRLSGWVDLNMFDRIYFENWVTHIESKDVETDLELFNGYVYGSRLSYQHNRKLSAKLFVEYNNFGEEWEFDPLITYKITPFTLFYVGSTSHYAQYNKDGSSYNPNDNNKFTHNKLDSRQFFMKIQYLFQL